MPLSYVHELAEAHLRGPGVHPREAIDARRRDLAIAACGLGPDHLDGEHVVAVIDDTPRRHVFVGATISDRRYAWRTMAGAGAIDWSDVESLEVREGTLLREQVFRLFDRQVRVPATRADLTPFFRALCERPLAERCQPPRPLTEPPPGDDFPASARAFTCSDPTHRVLYQLVWELHERDGQSPLSRDLCRRVSLLHRTTHEGRGMRDGGWLSPLAPTDLLCALDQALGASAHGIDDGLRWADYTLPAAWCDDARLGANGMQQRTLREAGYGQPLERIRVTVQPAAAGSGFAVRGFVDGRLDKTLSWQNPVLLADLFGALVPVERRALLRRILVGWQRPMPELLTEAIARLAPRALPEERLSAVGLM